MRRYLRRLEDVDENEPIFVTDRRSNSQTILRRHEVSELASNDPAAGRVPRMVTTTELSPVEAVSSLVRVEMAKDAALSFGAAMERVFAKHPTLYGPWRDETTLSRGGMTLAGAVPAGVQSVPNAATEALGWKLPKGPKTQDGRPTIEKVKPISSAEPSVSAAMAIINEKAKEIMATTDLSFNDARNKALAENPSLYAAYDAAMKRQIAGDTTDQG